MLGSMSSLSTRGYDAFEVSEDEYWFAPKPDGERMWITRIGMVWVYSRRLVRHSIIGWFVDDSIVASAHNNIGPTIDVEIMMGHGPIIIDVLLDEHGTISQEHRPLQWVSDTQTRLCNLFSYIRTIHQRQFRSTVSQAQMDCDIAPYPSDGIVAIPKLGSDMVKLKGVKSIELILHDDMVLRTSDDVALFRIKNRSNYQVGSIIEVRFTIEECECIVHEIFERPDKVTANSIEAVRSVIESSITRLSDNVIRTALWRWSNNIRGEIYSRAHAMNMDRRIIMDIGTGDGQSLDVHIRSSQCSYILVEPNPDKCRALQQRLRLKSFATEPRQLLQVISQLKTGKIRYYIINCTLEAILDDANVRSAVLRDLKCAIACFSAQYVIRQIPIFLGSGVPFIGVCYMYDDVDVGDSIINSHGLSMTRLDGSTASVKWGRDAPYIEPAIDSEDVPPGIVMTKATDLVEFPRREGMQDTASLCAHLQVLISRAQS
jgi:hypothetical protein